MMSSNKERERIQRLRDAQINQRSPGESKIRGYDWAAHAKRGKEIKKKTQKPLPLEIYEVLPSRWKGAIAGFVVGLFPLIAGQIFLEGDWKLLGLVGMLVCLIIGFVVGAATTYEDTKR
ncbi:MAG: hypothetical protein H6672_05275 [Anaerolineaceae bacterium]|nr:hypothetical protein [Anaerolineaceae bacterium]